MVNMLCKVLLLDSDESDDNREKDDLFSHNSCNNVLSISSESCEEDEDSGHQSVTHVDNAVSENSSITSSSVTESRINH